MDEARTDARDVPADRRTSDLGVQFEQVSLTLQQLRQTHASLQEMEARLGEMTSECAGILNRWAKNDEKHAAAVVELHGRLSEWNDIERRLLNESATRVHQFERSLQHEWNALKQKHEGPLQQLEAQEHAIAETCLTAVDQALKGFNRAEARLTELEQQLQREMSELAREVRGALAELRQGQAPLAARQSWSLDNVVRLHNELRADEDDAPGSNRALAASGTLGLAPAAVRAPRTFDAGADFVSEGAGARTVRATTVASGTPPNRWGAAATDRWRFAPIAGIVVLVAAIVAFGLYLSGRVSAGLRDAAARAEAAERDVAASRDLARQEMAAIQQAADARLATAQQAAGAAQLLATIVGAPDLKRFALKGIGDETPLAQLLWSRSHGLALSAARLPPPPTGRAYQLWLLTRTTPASVGVFVPSATGPTSAVFAWPADLRRAVIGAAVTIEPAAGSRQPSGPAWLASPVLGAGTAP